MSAKKNKNYSSESLNLALEAIKHGMAVKAASREYKIPKTTLHSKFHGKYPIECSAGAPPILTKEEENTLVKWIISVAKVGFPVNRDQLLESVRMLLLKTKKSNPFKDNRPGRHWYEGFLRRHPEISMRMSQNLVNSRAILTEAQIRNWFQEIEQYIRDNDLIQILDDPRRIYNADESAFFLCPKGKKVLAQRGSKTVYNHTANDEKECITTLVTGIPFSMLSWTKIISSYVSTANAAGELPPPMVMFAYERIPQSIVALMPDKWGLGKSESGWMTGQSFFEYVSNIFHPWLIKNNVPLPVLFYVDGHKSHLTMHLSDFCSQNGIVLISLFPNATHLLQPMDVGVFHPLKNGWRNAVAKFRTENNKQKIRKENFAPLLDTTIKEVVKTKIIQNAFRTCGLYPFDGNAINYSKLVSADPKTESAEHFSGVSQIYEKIEFNEKHMKFVESLIEKDKVEEFETCLAKKEEWMGNIKDDNLFILWKKLKESVIKTASTIPREKPNIEDLQDKENLPDDIIILEGDWVDEILNDNSQNQNMDHAGPPTTNAFVAETTVDIEIIEVAEKNNNLSGQVNTTVSSVEMEVEMMENSNKVDQESGNDKLLEKNSFELIESNMEDKMIMVQNKNNKSPDATSSNVPFDVPSPFKTILFWPEKPKTEKKKNIVKVPSVATSEQWKAYYRNKQEAKDKKEEEKENRKRLREEKLQLNKQTKEAKRKRNINLKKVTRRISTDTSEEEENASNFQNTTVNNPLISDENVNVGDYVIVDYFDIQYPGLIEEVRKDQAFVSVMMRSGNNWKWPLKKDVLWYNFDEIEEKIKDPVLTNKRGIFCVPEMKKFLK